MRRRVPLVLALALGACAAPDPRAELEVLALETYWAVDAPKAGEQYIAPAVRFEVRNKGERPWGSIQASAGFRRPNDQGVLEEWGGDWKQVAPSRKPLAPRERTLVVLKSDARYHSPGPPESMFQHAAFRDAKVEVYLRLGSSGWVKFGEAAVERRIGARSVPEDVREAPGPAASPAS
ncbi:MAG TPA: hypothetical protein VFM88_12880 [Vicinamibacteria bacterium]|nr:hypothetical protein [Vicinamibacteria bacterium]